MNLMAIKVPLSDAQIVPKFFDNLPCTAEIPLDLPGGMTLGVLKPLDVTTFVSIEYFQRAMHLREPSTLQEGV
jgi:hypothetical protein